ncbi:MAG: class I SAM-dependent methyltransferase [Bacteroidales bacterium]
MGTEHTNNTGQNINLWTEEWHKLSPISEIQMWDFYGGRQWVTKYTPRFGKILEAGCGLGRYVFYLSQMGIDIDGLDFSEKTINYLNHWKEENQQDAKFIKGDIVSLPYADNSLSGYISLGVVEHFIEGPQKPIAEAFRSLRPGGIAIITTPNISFLVLYRNILSKLKDLIKKIIGRKIINPPFFQYEYTPQKLESFLLQQGFHVSRSEACDLLYPFCEIGNFNGENLKKGKFAYWFASKFENTWLKKFGAQSITVSIKKAPVMYCFLSGKMTATPESLENFDVPISKEYQDTELAKLFLKNRKITYSGPYDINPPIMQSKEKKCDFSGKRYFTDPIFENFGFNKNVSSEMLKIPEVNIELCANNIKPIWRRRKQ